MVKSAAIVGASNNRAKFGNKAVRAYMEAGYEVYPINPMADLIEGVAAYASLKAVPVELDVISIYLPPEVGRDIIAEVAVKGAKTVYFNPGAFDDALIAQAQELGLQPVLACSIRAVGKEPSDYPE